MDADSNEPAPPRIAPPLPPPPLPPPPPRRPEPTAGGKWKRAFWPLVVLGAVLAKFKGVLVPFLKFFKFIPAILKTGGTMVVSIWAYSLAWGWAYALGFVLLILVHECGHLLAAKRIGLKVGAPVFIPFMGAFIALKEAPRNAWIEAQVGIGGPLLGTVGAVICFAISLVTGNPLFMALAYTGFFLNLFNLAPVGFLDGGRVVTALSPWLWIIGMGIVVFLLVTHFNLILLLIVLFSLPRLFSLFRQKSEEERRYFEVTPAQRWLMSCERGST